jgi:hypothetical protein
MLFRSEPDIACHAHVNDDVPLLLLFVRSLGKAVGLRMAGGFAVFLIELV